MFCSRSFNANKCWYSTRRSWTFYCRSSGHSSVPFRSNFVKSLFSLSAVGTGLLMDSFVDSSTSVCTCSQLVYLSSLSTVLASIANIGGTTLVITTRATLVPFLRIIFCLVLLQSPRVTLLAPFECFIAFNGFNTCNGFPGG